MKDTAKDEMMRVANNLRILREYNGDSQKNLAEKTGYSCETIRTYECGRRGRRKDRKASFENHNISEEYIESVAKQYCFPVNIIKEQQLSKELLESWCSAVKRSELFGLQEIFFCSAITSETALLNAHFKKAEEYCNRIKSLDYMEKMPEVAKLHYYESFIEEGIWEGAANTVMMLFVEYAHTNALPNTLPRIINGELTNGELYCQVKSLFCDLVPEKKRFIQSNQALFDKCIKALGCIPQGRIYAEYYTALKYVLCMIDNGRGFRENIEIGAIMMKEFAQIGNPLAKKAVDFFEFE